LDKKEVGEGTQPGAAGDQMFLTWTAYPFFLSFFLFFFFFWFNLKPQHTTNTKRKEMQKSLRAGTKRPLTMVLVNAF
jgi:hypothetical protein